MIPANAFLEVNLKNLVSNYKYLSFINKNHITGATIKANAYGLGDKKIIKELYKIKPPFNVNKVAQVCAKESLSDREFVKKSVKKGDARPFKVADNITMMVIDRFTGKKAKFDSKETLIEAFKKDKINIKLNQNLDINNRLKNNNILRFY